MSAQENNGGVIALKIRSTGKEVWARGQRSR